MFLPTLVVPVLTLYYRKRLASANGMEATSSASLAAAGAACIPYTTTVGWLPSMEWNGVAPATPGALRTRIPDAGKKAWFSVMEMDWRASRFRCRCSVPYISPVGLGFGNGNGECRRCSWIASQAAGGAGSATLYWGAVAGVMDNVEWSTEHGNIYSAL